MAAQGGGAKRLSLYALGVRGVVLDLAQVIVDPEQHDRITAYSQGLSYCVAQTIFDRPEIDALVQARMPDLHFSFLANHGLILDFLSLNAYMPKVNAVFQDAWQRTAQSSDRDLLSAFAQADEELNCGTEPSIPTKWYEKLRAASNDL